MRFPIAILFKKEGYVCLLGRVLCIVCTIGLLMPAAALAAPAPVEGSGYLITIPKVTGAKLTADLNRPPWTQAACITGFSLLRTQQLSPDATWVYACYDDSALWLAYRCSGPVTKTEFAERDGKVWRDDSVEFYCSPDGKPRRFRQFTVNAAGVVYDALYKDATWNSQCEVATARDAQGWTVALRIPFADLTTKTPAVGDIWAVNFARHAAPAGSSSWTWVYDTLQDMAQFGSMVFGGPTTTPVRMESMPAATIGPNKVLMTTPRGVACSVRAFDRISNPVSASVSCDLGSDALSFTLTDDHIRRLQIEVTDAARHPLARWWSTVDSPVVAARITAWLKQVDDLKVALPKFAPALRASTQHTLDELAPRLDKARAILADPNQHRHDNWLELDKLATDLDRTLGNASHYTQTLKLWPNARFAVGLESSMRKVMIRDFPFEGRVTNTCHLRLAANEHEALQVVVIAQDADVKDAEVRVKTPVLVPSDSNAKPRRATLRTQVSLVGHVDVDDNPPYKTDYHGWWPDPLIDFQTKADVKPGEHVAFWVDLQAPKGTPPGQYKGTISVHAASSPPIEIELVADVWDFTLDDGTHLPNAFTFHQHGIGYIHKDRWDDRMIRKYQDLVLDHRLGIDQLYRKEPPDIDLLKYAFRRGMSEFNITFLANEGGMGRVLETLHDYMPRIKTAGLDKAAYVYGFDEVHEDRFPGMKEAFDAFHRDFPGLKTMTTAQDESFGRDTGLRDAVDIWVPLTPSYDLDEARALRAEGKQMWWYICLVPTHPYANWFIEYPAIESRLLMGAMSYKYEVDGFLYYLLNSWQGNHAPIHGGPYTEWDPGSCDNREGKTANGDGNLFYPGPDGPLSSIRLENIRDGLEDYEYLWLLTDQVNRIAKLSATPERSAYLSQARTLLAVPPGVVNDVVQYTLDPAALYAWRDQIADMIVKGKDIPGTSKKK